MGFRFRKQIKVVPGVKLNLSKSGVSTSIGKAGATVNVGKNGIKTTVGIPGSGMSYSVNENFDDNNSQSSKKSEDSKAMGRIFLYFLIAFMVLCLACFLLI